MSNSQPPPPQKLVKNVLVAEDDDTDFLLIQRKLIKLLKPGIIDRAKNRSELNAALLVARDLIVADYHLADIEERELMEAITRAQPDTACLIFSGSVTHVDRRDLHKNVIAVIEKGDKVELEKILRGYFGELPVCNN